MEKSENQYKLGLNTIYLAKCALWDVIPQTSMVESMDIPGVYAMAKKQSMLAVTWYGLEKWLHSGKRQALDTNVELLTKWEQARDMAIRKNTMLDIAREQLQKYMDDNGIWYMPLKGSILKDLYPRPGMRQMADNDILIDGAYRRQVFDYMKGQGYEGEYREHSIHDEYQKKPFYNFEIHNALVSQKYLPAVVEYYSNVRERLVNAEGCGYSFRNEDFYIYMMVHAHRHHYNAGNGIRHIMDTQVYLEKMPALDYDYVRRELDCLGIAKYEATVRSLSNKLFDKACSTPEEMDEALTTDEREFLAFNIDAGTYGTSDIRVGRDLQKLSKGKQLTVNQKLRYCWMRLIRKGGIQYDFPRLAKYRILYPVLYVARAIKMYFFNRKRLHNELKAVYRFGGGPGKK